MSDDHEGQNYTLKQLIEGLPGDDASNDIRTKFAVMEAHFGELAKQHTDLKQTLVEVKRLGSDADEEISRLNSANDSLRKQASEKLASLKANIQALQEAKAVVTAHTVVWRSGVDETFIYKTFTGPDCEKAAGKFFHALGDVERIVLDGEMKFSAHHANFLAPWMEERKAVIDAQLDALGFEPEVHIPDEVEQTLRDVRQWMTYRMQDTDHPAPQAMVNLFTRIGDMLVDDEPHDTTDWEDSAEELEHVADMVLPTMDPELDT